MKIFNSFSIGLFGRAVETNFNFKAITHAQAAKMLVSVSANESIESFVTSPGTAKAITNIIGLPLESNTNRGRIEQGETAVIVNVVGGRIEDDGTVPENCYINFYVVKRS